MDLPSLLEHYHHRVSPIVVLWVCQVLVEPEELHSFVRGVIQ